MQYKYSLKASYMHWISSTGFKLPQSTPSFFNTNSFHKGSYSSVASPICQEGQSERNFPIFAFSSRFFLFFPDFSWFFRDFSRFLANFSLSGVALCHPNGYATGQLYAQGIVGSLGIIESLCGKKIPCIHLHLPTNLPSSQHHAYLHWLPDWWESYKQYDLELQSPPPLQTIQVLS